jgi:hypothetical protein
MGGLTFDRGVNGCFGPVVGVYGSSALKDFVLATAADFCNWQLASGASYSSAIDVEYNDGGDSCPGLDFAADYSDDNEVGASDLFATGCTGTQARSSTKVNDVNGGFAVNVVNAITNCGSSTTSPQNGDPFGNTHTLVSCQGAVPGTPKACGALPANTFAPPNSISTAYNAGEVWNTSSPNFVSIWINGCTDVSVGVQLRVPGSGTRATWCYNLYGPGSDCLGNTTAGNAATSSVMETDVCGNPYTTPVTPAADPIGTVGHTSRATILIDPRSPDAGQAGAAPGTAPPLQACGIVQANGADAWNRTCDPTVVQTTSQPYSSTDLAGVRTCNGDLQVAAAGDYPMWGYEHLYLNAAATAGGANAEA